MIILDNQTVYEERERQQLTPEPGSDQLPEPQEEGLFSQLSVLLIVILFVLLLILAVILLIVHRMKRNQNRKEQREEKKLQKRLSKAISMQKQAALNSQPTNYYSASRMQLIK